MNFPVCSFNLFKPLMLKSVQNEFLVMSYAAMSFGPANAEKLFKNYTSNGDFNSIIRCPDGSYRRTTHPDIVLDYHTDEKGTVVRQKMWQPSQTGDVRRHVQGVRLLPPVFFIRTDNIKGVDMSHVRSGGALNILHSNEPARLGGLATTHLTIKVREAMVRTTKLWCI